MTIYNDEELDGLFKEIKEASNWEYWILMEAILENALKIMVKRRDLNE